MIRAFLISTVSLLLAGTALAQTVTVTLTSPQNGAGVAPGATISWQIAFTASAGDNQGLALLSADLTQDAGNATLLDIPPADSVPAAMSNFSRPDGISNPGETDPVSGYTGVQRGTAGQQNLIQIGGGQNTFGQALPVGAGIGENANVAAGVGQGGSQMLASGSFVAPSACGSYTFSLANVQANVLTQVNAPPTASTVASATVDASAGTITFSVVIAGDLDGDGDVDLGDLAVMLSNFGTPSGALPEDGDLDGDGDVDLADLAVQLANFGSVCQ